MLDLFKELFYRYNLNQEAVIFEIQACLSKFHLESVPWVISLAKQKSSF